MSETKMVSIPEPTLRKLKAVSEKFSKLNTGAIGDNFWIGTSEGGGGYDWSQFDIGVNRSGQLITCSQSGCSCNGPEEPTPDAQYNLDEDVNIEEDYDGSVGSAVEDLVKTTDTLYSVLRGKDVSAKEVISIPNAELRRAVIELVGYDRLVSDADVLDESSIDGRLLKIKLDGDEDLMLLHVKDSSTDREYFLRVPPKMKTARQARAWTFGFEAEDFDLAVEA